MAYLLQFRYLSSNTGPLFLFLTEAKTKFIDSDRGNFSGDAFFLFSLRVIRRS